MQARGFGHEGRTALTITAKRSLVTLLIVTMLWCTIGVITSMGGQEAQQSARPTFAAYTGNDLRVGISFGNTLLSMTDNKLAEALDGVVDTGARWIRFDMSWSDVQPTSAQA